ncbi:aminopeptidase [Psychrobacillus sp. NEAU-3TGS]|uniref:aminopeptidase n=1 Tax=Psychrobacillus sp. NEAU-3TGS TaxID=2995412 RepID=UPI002496015E|nr:aminopeptidase [Psychrobacillus sp. NEAU-3TGS]MDI2587610.1 aminopeptidase [Psychrobacillus sp. NEAU-3TGS]
MSTIEKAKNVLINNLHIKKDETLLVLTDTALSDIAQYFVEAGRELGNETISMQMSTRSKSGEEPPHLVSQAMLYADVVLCITEHSLTHTVARKNASKKGARVATMPGVTLDMLEEGAISANAEEIEELTAEYCRMLDEGSTVTIEKDGMSLSFSIEKRQSIASTGVFKEKGQSGNIPSGESYIAPIENSANGKVIIDGSIAGIGLVQEPIILEIKDGRLVNATGSQGKQLLEILGEDNGRIIAEFGIGTNKKARLTGNILEDEKVFGTVHIAFGSNKSFGGENEAGVHIDCLIKDPIITIN